MGILDDAIREHLELKRSHGASEDEISRKEAEVFGPPRQDLASPQAEAGHGERTQLLAPDEAAEVAEPHQDAPFPPDDAPFPPALERLDPAPEDPYAVHPGDDLVPDPDVPPAGAETVEAHRVDSGPPVPPAHDHDEQHPALIDHDHIGGEEHPPEPVFRHAPLEHPEVDEQPPRQAAERADADGEDVLEETPEFLQDAPEHDRLWFEQKPPRDFDFGE
jgi:hypothetical protein